MIKLLIKHHRRIGSMRVEGRLRDQQLSKTVSSGLRLHKALHNIGLKFTRSFTHDDGGVNHARRQPARQEQ